MNGLFIATVLRAALTKFSYNDQINSQTILVQTVKLPALSGGDPDWEYMDAYMHEVMEEASDNMEKLFSISG